MHAPDLRPWLAAITAFCTNFPAGCSHVSGERFDDFLIGWPGVTIKHHALARPVTPQQVVDRINKQLRHVEGATPKKRHKLSGMLPKATSAPTHTKETIGLAIRPCPQKPARFFWRRPT